MNTKYLLFVSLSLIFTCLCKLENEETYDLILKTKRETEGTGRKGVIAFSTNSSETVDIFSEDFMEVFRFDSKFILRDDPLTPNVRCSLFKPKEKGIYILCDLQQELTPGEIYLKLEDYTFEYNGKKIKIFSEDYIKIVFMPTKAPPFLYADKQTIDLADGKDVHELKFKIKIFNEGDSVNLISKSEKLVFNNINIRNYCTINGNELICKIKEDTLAGYLTSIEDTFMVKSYGESYQVYPHELIFDIIIKYHVYKKNTDVKITKLLNGIANNGVMASYETDLTDISPCATTMFDLEFTLDGSSDSYKNPCFFKKFQDGKPLVLLCLLDFKQSGNYTLSPTKYNTKLENINAKYIFNIKPIENAEKINYSTNSHIGGVIDSIYPNILDFTKKDSYKVVFGGEIIRNLKELVFEPSLNKLECNYNLYDIECTIPKSYFKDQKNGYYYAYQTNHAGGKSPCYETEPIKIILPDDSKSFAEKLNIYGYIFAILIAFTLI